MPAPSHSGQTAWAVKADLLLHPEGRFLESQLHLDGQIVTPGRTALLRGRPERAGRTHRRRGSEQVAETGEAVEVEAAGATAAAAQAVMAVGVVDLAASRRRRAPRRPRWLP